MHSVSAWKEAKLQFYGGPDVAALQRRPLIHVFSLIFARVLSFDLLYKESQDQHQQNRKINYV